MELDATFWATVALIVFLAFVLYLKVPAMVAKNLDERAEKIRDELAEARKMREEAQAILASYQRKRKEAQSEAEDIVTAARNEAQALSAEAKRKTEEFVARRTAMAENKIAQAEAQAMADVKAAAVDLAVIAAEKIVAGKVSGAAADKFIKSSITEVKANLN